MFNLEGKCAVVVGGTSGIGKAIALGLASAGANVVASSRSKQAVEDFAADLEARGSKTLRLPSDVLDRRSLQRLHDSVLETFGHIDILVNSAGITKRVPTIDCPEELWQSIMNVNLNGTLRACQIFGETMLKQRKGRIINIASLLTFQGGVFVPSYAAAKGGVGQLTKAFANEWASRGINVNAIAPGYMETDNTSALRADPVRSRQILERIPAGRWGTPSDLAGAAVFLASRASDYLHGHVLVVDGGWMSR